MNKFVDIKLLWDDELKYTFDDLSIPMKTIRIIIKDVERLKENGNEKVDDLYILLNELKDLFDKEINIEAANIISKYYQITDNIKTLDKLEQFGILKIVVQKLIYDLAERGEECEN